MVETIINTKTNVKDSDEIIELLGQQLMDSGFVKETYVEAVLKREKTLPTGLKTGFVNVAIPHTDVTHVNKSAIAISTLEKPVNFSLMEDPTKEVDVEFVFLLAVKEPGEQTKLLKSLMSIFQNIELLNQMKNAKDSRSLNDILKSSLFL